MRDSRSAFAPPSLLFQEIETKCYAEPYLKGQKDAEALDKDLGALQVSMADWRLPLWSDAREIAVRVATSAFG